MESDWGLPYSYCDNDDFVQDYSKFSETELEDFIHDESAIYAATEEAIQSKKSSKSRKRKRDDKERKKEDKSRPYSNEELFSQILSWDVEEIARNESVGMMSRAPAVYESKQHYFSTIREVCVEESRAGLHKGLKCSECTLKLRFNSLHPGRKGDDRVLIEFKILKGDTTFTHPGWTYALARRHDASRIFATIAQGALAMKLASAAGCTVPLWVNSKLFHKTFNLQEDSGLTSMSAFLENDHEWLGEGLANLISYQRMTTACNMMPTPPFLYDLLGKRQSLHLKFEYDDDDDDNYAVEDHARAPESTPPTDTRCNSLEKGLTDSAIERMNLNSSQLSALRGCVDEIEQRPASTGPGGISLIQGPPGLQSSECDTMTTPNH